MRQWLELQHLAAPQADLEYLPFQFTRWHDGQVLLTNLVGEHMFVTAEEFDAIARKEFADDALVRRLRAKHLVRQAGDRLPIELLALKFRTQHAHLADFTGLHIFVVTLRCEHSCRYCQVSRQQTDKTEFDMTPEIANRALEMAFRTPATSIKIEFQGGEPLLNFPLIRHITSGAKRLAAEFGKTVAFVIATNLALLDDQVLAFAAEHDVQFSTSIDGPADLHNRN